MMNANNSDSNAPRINSVAERIAALQRRSTNCDSLAKRPPSYLRGNTTCKASNIKSQRNTNIVSSIVTMQKEDRSKDHENNPGKVTTLVINANGLSMEAWLPSAQLRKLKVRNSDGVSHDRETQDLYHTERVTIGHGRRRSRKIIVSNLKFSTE